MENQEKTFTEEIVSNLKKEVAELNKSLAKCRQTENFAMYKNLINGYRDIVRLIQDLNWREMNSTYGMRLDNGEFINVISTWKQNGDNQIKDHKVYGRVDLDNINFNKGDKIEFDGKNYITKCVDNEYAVFCELVQSNLNKNTENVNMESTIILSNKLEDKNLIKYKKIN